jgi:hypothetical protein
VEALAGRIGGSDGAEEEVGGGVQRNKIKELFFLIVDFEGAATRRRQFAGDKRVLQGRYIDFATWPVQNGQELTSGEAIWYGGG